MADAELTQTGGATGEPEGAAVSQPEAGDEALLASLEKPVAQAPQVDQAEADFLKRLESLDPSKLPDSLRQKFEMPFLQNYTRKYQDLAQQQQAILQSVTGKLSQAGVEATPDQKAALLEKIRMGDFDVLDQYVDRAIKEKMGPLEGQIALRSAMEEAEKLHPYIKDRQAELAQIIAQDPRLRELATVNNFQNAPLVLNALAIQMEANEMKQKLAGMDQTILAAQRQAVEAYKRKISGLPASTSMAGSTPTATPEAGYKSLKDAAKAAWEQLGGTPVEHW
jgi:hypothetical protein